MTSQPQGTSPQGSARVAPLAEAVQALTAALHDPTVATTPTIAELREQGWQVIQLAGGLADLAALLAGHTGAHAADLPRLCTDDGDPAGPQVRLAAASRDLAALRRALEQAQTQARAYYAGISHLHPTTGTATYRGEAESA